MGKLSVEEMLEAGLHFGHQTFRWHPKMKPYIFDARDGIHIIDLVQTEEKLKAALDFAAQLSKQGGNILLVGTKRQASDIIAEVAKAAGLPYVANRWPGGLLTNFSSIKNRINYLKQLREKMASKDFGDMTKKEVGLLEKELANLEESFGGVDNLTALPDALFIVDVLREKIALKEALRLNIPVIAMVDTNADPSGIEFVIPANDDAKQGIRMISQAIVDTLGGKRPVSGSESLKARGGVVPKSKKAVEQLEEQALDSKDITEVLEQKEVQLAEAKHEEEKLEAEKREKRATTKRKA
ncbi:30S ribosomal protein S2 [candidate division Kazan bacterium RIFCSPHIGHO2_01_FULL_49_10]|uniref:Small ribosomal subunit protein uS2 n=1 Tax=candidate division Kazan bacterium RIFCSPLOWO2_01_FULL_48_13 TaxID=1798539 RepID=A0A1F4PNU1_UNCK3|nr:MAG: 30S ribosomal protein S2 [candidate division Kazan bacterium RIFCSPHIGHO2_01_FULL_49_10]OGB85324.1 MAG: 30S ribosomal protein S2 [candidate division Kazan bacterium RIFCSPLOWO2_01_FULL_48_13]